MSIENPNNNNQNVGDYITNKIERQQRHDAFKRLIQGSKALPYTLKTGEIIEIEPAIERDSTTKDETSYIIYAARIDTQLVGFITMNIRDLLSYKDISIRLAQVNKEYQRKGIATALYDKLEYDLRSVGAHLTPSAESPKDGLFSTDAHALWQKRQ